MDLPWIRNLLPMLIVIAGFAVLLSGVRWVLARRARRRGRRQSLAQQLILLLLTVVGLIALVLTLPLSEATRNQLLSLLGLVLTAIIALSSTSFVANAMAGLMLRAVGSFRPGDFVRVDNQFGRVTEQGLFHTEIQTEEGNLTMLPNLVLSSQPLTVVRASGTIVSAELSLGYDVPHATVEPLLEQAAESAGLEEPFVLVTELGNFAVTYRVAGRLTDVGRLLTARSELRRAVLDSLHGAGIEIASPTVMAQRPLPPEQRLIPPVTAATAQEAPTREEPPPEERIFDKAEEAGRREQLRTEYEQLGEQIRELEREQKQASGDAKSVLAARLEQAQARAEALAAQLEAAEADTKTDVTNTDVNTKADATANGNQPASSDPVKP